VKLRDKILNWNFDLRGGGPLGSGYHTVMETQMTEFQSDTAEWWARCRRIDRIHETINMFPEMTEEDGGVLAGCLATLTRGQTLTSDQEAMYRRWWKRLTDVKTAAQRQSRGPTLAEQVEVALATLPLSKLMRIELTDALIRLQSGGRMSPRQAGLWGTHVLPKLRAACV
jgi:hypothetical protein